MLTSLLYQNTGQGARIVRCFGSGSILTVPERIGDLPVTSLADHCFAREGSVLYRKEELRLWTDPALAGGENASAECGDDAPAGGFGDNAAAKCGDDAPAGGFGENAAADNRDALCAGMIHQLVLPPMLLEIGSYAFYGCENLTGLRIPLGLKRLGSGALTGCGRLTQLDFYGSGDEAGDPGTSIIREIIGDLDHEARIRVFSGIFAEDEYTGDAGGCGEPYRISGSMPGEEGETRKTEKSGDTGKTGKRSSQPLYLLTFPGYYEESVENTPARIIEIHYEGTGFKYRQCFRKGKIEFDRYDDLFPAARAMETPATAMRIAQCRLMYPYGLHDEAAAVYVSFLQQHSRECAEMMLQEENILLLRALLGCGFFTEELLSEWTSLAAGHSAESVSLLMEYRRVHFPPRRKTFEF